MADAKKNKGCLLSLTFDKNQSKKIFLKNCQKILFCPFSADPELKALASSVKINSGTNELQMIGHYENE